MTFDTIVALGGFLVSIIAIFLAIKKSSHELDNLDSDTIAKLMSTIKDQEEMYRTLKKEFDEYKILTTDQINKLTTENSQLKEQLAQYRKEKGRKNAI